MKQLDSIAVYPASLYQTHRRLWEALGELGYGEIRAWQAGDEERVAVAWMQGPPETLVSALGARGGRCLVWPAPEASTSVVGGPIEFTTAGALDPVLHGEVIGRHEALEVAALAVGPGVEVLAMAGGRPWWTREWRVGGAVIDRLGVRPPVLKDGQLLRQHLKPWRMASLLPLVHVAREVGGTKVWDAPPARACFIFDDPSLHRPSYGCLRFEELARHAEQHGYHAAIATVPFDAWGANPRVRAVFERHPDRLSLLMHGNDHLRHEMWSPRSEAEWTAVLAQALRRVGRFERQEGLAVARVMEAPHALVSRCAFGPLGRLGYDAALVSPALAAVYACEDGWPVALGCAALDAPLEGVCSLPRVPLSSHWKTDVLLAAFLRQPIIVAGHHQDAAEGLDFLAELAARVNRVGGVPWSGLGGVVRSRWQVRREGTTMRLRMGARRVECPVPAGTTEVRIERPWTAAEHERLEVGEAAGNPFQPEAAAGAMVIPVPAAATAPITLHVVSRPHDGIDPEQVPEPQRRAWPVLRRFIAEARDRVFPYVPAKVRRRPPAYRVP